MRVQLAIGIWSSAFVASLGLGVGCGSTTSEQPGELAACDDTSNTEQNGFVKCHDETVHRPRVEACDIKVPRSDVTCEAGGNGACTLDTDCKDAAHGYCTLVSAFAQSCQCAYGCVQDADCADDQICQCSGVAGECKPAGCSEDADCPGSVCASYDVDFCGAAGPGFACVTTRDECLSYADCPDGKSCWYADGKRSCQSPTCAIGRPFLVDSEIRTAALRPGSGWNCEAGQPLQLDPSSQALPEKIRTEIIAHYLHSGLMEHAAVAAFARFALQLMGLGAPKDLVLRAITAQADELRHAELCFSVATHCGGGLEPGQLELDRALAALSPRDVLVTTLLEGCIGETVAAALAEEAALLCTDPALKAMHRQIALDEARHARLAWHSVQWLLRAYPELKPEAAKQFSRALAVPFHAENQPKSAATASLEAYGVLSRERSAALHAAVLREVVAPAARAMLGAVSERRTTLAAA